MSSAKTTTGIKGDANLDYWREVPCPDCKKVGPSPYERCRDYHFWTHVPKSNEDIDEHGDTYKCYYCLVEIGS
jgi:hypothetical protein